MKMKTSSKVARIAVIVLICLACLIPFYILIVLSLNAPSRVFYEGNLFVPNFYWQNYVDAWHKSKIGTAMVNSAIITAGTLVVTIVSGGLAGYAIARHSTRYNKFVFGLLIGCMMIPGIINTVPLYVLMRKIHAVNTLWGMICVCSALAMPSAVFIFTTFIRALPRELDEAAALDGCSPFMTFWRVVFPVIKRIDCAGYYSIFYLKCTLSFKHTLIFFTSFHRFTDIEAVIFCIDFFHMRHK